MRINLIVSRVLVVAPGVLLVRMTKFVIHTVSSLVIKFNIWILAQIVENRETRLSRPFVGPGGNYSKSYDENRSAIHITALLLTWDLLATGEITRKLMRKTDLPYNSAGDLGTAGDCGRLCEKLWRKQICPWICHTILLVTWDQLVTAGDYAKNYDENRSAIHY